jgi:hypothetical protein
MEPRKRRGRKRRDSACRARSRPRDSFGNIRALLSCKTTDAAMACSSSSCKKMEKIRTADFLPKYSARPVTGFLVEATCDGLVGLKNGQGLKKKKLLQTLIGARSSVYAVFFLENQKLLL